MTDRVFVTTGSRAPYIPSYISYAEGSIDCPLHIHFRNFQINVNDLSINFVFNKQNIHFTPMPIEGVVEVLKTSSSAPCSPTSSVPDSPASVNMFVNRVEWQVQQRPVRQRPNLQIVVPAPALSTSPLTPSPVSCNPETVISEFLEAADAFTVASMNALQNKTWLPFSTVLQTLVWLPDIIRTYDCAPGTD